MQGIVSLCKELSVYAGSCQSMLGVVNPSNRTLDILCIMLQQAHLYISASGRRILVIIQSTDKKLHELIKLYVVATQD